MSKDRVTIDELVPVNRERAFLLYTRHIDQWYIVNEHTVPHGSETQMLMIEEHVGGRFMAITDVANKAGDVLGTIEHWQPPEHFSYRDNRNCLITVRFVPENEHTRVSVEVLGLSQLPAEEADLVRRYGWHTTLRWFAAHVSGIENGGTL